MNLAEFTLIISPIALLMSIGMDLNWGLFKTFVPTKLLGPLRLVQVLSAFALAYMVTVLFLECFMINQYHKWVIATISAVAFARYFFLSSCLSMW